MDCIILIWKSVAKVPVVTGLYVVEELEERDRESTKISRGIGGQALKARKSRPCVMKTMHELTLIEIHFLG